MDSVQYEKRVIEYFQSGKATEDDWMMLGQLVLEASENALHLGIQEFDRRILSTEEFNAIYEDLDDLDYDDYDLDYDDDFDDDDDDYFFYEDDTEPPPGYT